MQRVRHFINPSVSSSFITTPCLLDNRPYVSVSVFDSTFPALLDSGASCSILGRDGLFLLNKYDLPFLPSTEFSPLRTADGRLQDVRGTLSLPLTVDGISRVLKVLVVSSISQTLTLGVDFLTTFKVRTDFSAGKFFVDSSQVDPPGAIQGLDDLSSRQKAQLSEVIALFRTLDKPQLGRTSLITHKIDTGDAEPLKQRYYPFSPNMLAKANREIDKMLAQGVIRPSCSPWNSPMVLVKKKASEEYRVCFDAKQLNKLTKKDSYPIPYLSDILNRLRDARFISSIDLKKAFWQVGLHPDSIEKTAFTVPLRGLFEYVVMPMGLSNSPATQQRLMDKVLGPVLGQKVFCYLDDIIVATASFSEHLSLLKDVFHRLKEANLTINLDKCEFCRPRLTYLGYVVDREGLRTDPAKVAAIIDYPIPRTVTEVKRFIGVCAWFKRFIKDFAMVVAPILELIKGKVKRQTVEWNEEADNAFKNIKTLLSSAPVLSSPNFSQPFYIQCDASDCGVGCVLTQGEGEKECVIAYASRSLSRAERNYSVTERELLAVLFGVEKFRPYIEGTRFTVITDHHSLVWLHNLKDPTGRLARWCLKLQQYDFDVVHRKGKFNVVPDALSRAPLQVSSLDLSPVDLDPWCRRMVQRVLASPDRFPFWRVENGLLYKFSANHRHNLVSNLREWKLVIPKRLRLRVIAECHDFPTAGHMGMFKTLSRISELYYWPKMRQDVFRYVRSCKACLASKSPNVAPSGLMGKEKEVRYPFQCISLDLLGPFPRSRKGYTSLLVVCDWFTKFVLVHPLRKATAAEIGAFLENHVFLTYGVPQICMMDNGPQFVSSQFRDLLAKYDIPCVWYNARYHPQVNPTERVNRVVVTAIRALLKSDHREWDQHVHEIAHSIRTSVHEVTGYTPSFLVFGRTVPSSGSFYGRLADSEDAELTIASRERLIQDMNELSEVHQQVVPRLKAAYHRSAERYNLRKRELRFKVGDLVWKKNFVLSNAGKNYNQKLAPKYVLSRVAEITGPLTYRLTSISNGKSLGIFHVKDLKAHGSF